MAGDNDTTRLGRPTRRKYVKYGGAVIGGGLLAGCASDSGMNAEGTVTTSETGTETDDGTGTTNDDKTTTEADGSYTVTMSPMGTVEFEGVPESAMTYSQLYTDAAVALGHGSAVNSLGFSWYGDILDFFYESLDGVSFDSSSLPQVYSNGLDKEIFYELDSDVHFMDPTWPLSSAFGWKGSDVEEIAENVGPWFGNSYSRLHSDPPSAYDGEYEYYSLWEIVEKVAAVFRERERYEALADLHATLLNDVESALPAKSERPSVALTMYYEGRFRVYFLNDPGYARSFTRPFGAADAFADADGIKENSGWVDMEGMLELNPDVILQFWGITPDTNMADLRAELEGNAVGQRLAAVANGRVYASGVGGQGPIMNLFQLEMTAKQLYPEQFGEWPGYTDGEPYPEIPEEEQLFDHQRVADIVNGEF
ncbi:ABC transporter substrate-binding protein [Haladaptatus sp. CMAA 1909]|uniref:ABC transporter substrate-binding protein n=1 Tax=Haladaptatus sp. CMAA 1909 TaxID=3368986 RepID=UPI0037548426